MEIGTYIKPDGIAFSSHATCKKQLLEEVAEFASRHTGIPVAEVFETLTERERLGSTGFGNGIAIPHGKLTQLDAVFLGLLILDKPVEFDSPDGELVDVVFVLLVPEDASSDHLKLLACVARASRNTDLLQRIRGAKDPQTVYRFINELPDANAA